MKIILVTACLFLAACSSDPNRERWETFSKQNNCVALGKSKKLLAGSVYSIPQRRIVYEFKCGSQKVWSDLGNYAKYNEWLEI